MRQLFSKCSTRYAHTTIVTAYFRIPSKHSEHEYQVWIRNMLSLQDAMVIFTSPDLVEYMKFWRQHAIDRTCLIPMSLKETRMATQFDTAFWEMHAIFDPGRHIHPNYQLYLIWNEKTEWLKRTLDANPFHSQFFAWVDIGYFRTGRYNGQTMIQQVPRHLRRDQILVLNSTGLVDTNSHQNGLYITAGCSLGATFRSYWPSHTDTLQLLFITSCHVGSLS